MPSITSIQAAVSNVLDALNVVRTEAAVAVGPRELESAEGTLADAQGMEEEMSRSAAIIVATLGQIQTALAERTATVRESLKNEALERVAALVKSGALSLDDVVARLGVGFTLPPAAPAPVKPQAVAGSSSGKYMNPDKYRNPHTGETWSGRGPAPKWLKALAVDGKTIEDFRIDATSNTPAPVAAQAPAAPVADPAPAEATVVAASASSDIGDTVTFDGNLDDDIGGETTSAGSDSDIGEMLTGLQAPGTVIQDGLSA